MCRFVTSRNLRHGFFYAIIIPATTCLACLFSADLITRTETIPSAWRFENSNFREKIFHPLFPSNILKLTLSLGIFSTRCSVQKARKQRNVNKGKIITIDSLVQRVAQSKRGGNINGRSKGGFTFWRNCAEEKKKKRRGEERKRRKVTRKFVWNAVVPWMGMLLVNESNAHCLLTRAFKPCHAVTIADSS